MQRPFYLKYSSFLICTWGLVLGSHAGCDQTNSERDHLKIIGGEPVAAGGYPEVVAFMRDELTLCTGTLIDKDLVLTAAHCFEKTINAGSAGLGNIRVVVGSKSTTPGPLLTTSIVQAKTHPMYWLDHRGAFDFAWVKIDPPLSSVIPAALPVNRAELELALADTLAKNTPAEIVGFGISSRELREEASAIGLKNRAEIPIVLRTGVELFAGNSAADTCSGDSGGPLFLRVPSSPRHPGGRLLAGVTSRGPVPCAADFGQGAYGLTSETICWLRTSASWHTDDLELTDFCVREIARHTSTPLDPVVMNHALREACQSQELAQDSRQDLEHLMHLAGIDSKNPRERCDRLAAFLSEVKTLDLSAKQFRQVSWLKFATKLKNLDAHDNMMTDITPLLDLRSLKSVDLRNNRIADIKNLHTLAKTVAVIGFKTQWSNLDDTHYRELAERGAALSAEKRALVIALRETLVDGPIARKSRDLALKRQLNLDRRGIRSLEALRGLENLEALSIVNNTDITDWEELLSLPKLNYLRMGTDQRLPETIVGALLQRGVTIERR
jgi:hypothetical protein